MQAPFCLGTRTAPLRRKARRGQEPELHKLEPGAAGRRVWSCYRGSVGFSVQFL